MPDGTGIAIRLDIVQQKPPLEPQKTFKLKQTNHGFDSKSLFFSFQKYQPPPEKETQEKLDKKSVPNFSSKLIVNSLSLIFS